MRSWQSITSAKTPTMLRCRSALLSWRKRSATLLTSMARCWKPIRLQQRSLPRRTRPSRNTTQAWSSDWSSWRCPWGPQPTARRRCCWPAVPHPDFAAAACRSAACPSGAVHCTLAAAAAVRRHPRSWRGSSFWKGSSVPVPMPHTGMPKSQRMVHWCSAWTAWSERSASCIMVRRELQTGWRADSTRSRRLTEAGEASKANDIESHVRVH
mmetsp:Transcript_66415/g.190915  ORF Transcript_66415/g.190915 Transcript_66415/m.190915 type:complete len:211 (+) Transcript_66415:595-1227(+)